MRNRRRLCFSFGILFIYLFIGFLIHYYLIMDFYIQKLKFNWLINWNTYIIRFDWKPHQHWYCRVRTPPCMKLHINDNIAPLHLIQLYVIHQPSRSCFQPEELPFPWVLLFWALASSCRRLRNFFCLLCRRQSEHQRLLYNNCWRQLYIFLGLRYPISMLWESDHSLPT